jgi:sulfide:quinone oxidoreductase
VARCLILGAGFGGLAAAHELRASLGDEDRVTVVANSARFFAGLATLWDIVGLRPLEQGSRPLARLRERGIEFFQAEITGIDAERRTVETTGGVLEGDYLVVALGAAFDPTQVRQLDGSAHNLYDAGALPAIRRDLEVLDRGAIVVAVLGAPYKCPPAPYEATLLIDDWLRRRGSRDSVAMTVFTAQPSALPVAGPDASARVAQTLAQRGIAFHSDHKPAGVERGSIRFENGRVERFDMLLAVPRHVAPAVVADGPLAGPSGWIEPDPRTLRTSFEGVYAVGDCISVPLAKGQLPKAGVFAEAHGRIAARNIIAEIQGGTEAEFDGRGYCFMELGDGTAAYVEGDFLAEPEPDVRMSEPDEETFRAKQAFERERLEAWF